MAKISEETYIWWTWMLGTPLQSLINYGRLKQTREGQKSLKILQQELQTDLDLEDDPRYKAMLAECRNSTLDQKQLNKALYRPQALGSRPYPIYASELAHLCQIVGLHIQSKTIERLTQDGLISEPLLVGSKTLLRPTYFARHLVEVLYSQLIMADKPERVRAYLRVLRGQLTKEELLYLSGLPGVKPELIRTAGGINPDLGIRKKSKKPGLGKGLGLALP